MFDFLTSRKCKTIDYENIRRKSYFSLRECKALSLQERSFPLNQVISPRFFNGFQFTVHAEFTVNIFDVFANGTWR